MSDIIQVTYGELTTSFENEVMKAVQQVGINVNKEELLKALELADKLVHCKDCKFKRLYDGETKHYYCALEDRPNRNWSVDDWDFCSWGERIDNVTVTDGEQIAVCKMPFVGFEWRDNWFDDEVIAWMPLPKPYEGADDE